MRECSWSAGKHCLQGQARQMADSCAQGPACCEHVDSVNGRVSQVVGLELFSTNKLL